MQVQVLAMLTLHHLLQIAIKLPLTKVLIKLHHQIRKIYKKCPSNNSKWATWRWQSLKSATSAST